MTMLKSNLHPPRNGLNADPVLYGIAAGLAELFPPVDPPQRQETRSSRDHESGRDKPRERSGQE